MGLDILLILFLVHFVSDFLLQSRKMGENKSTSMPWLVGHIGIIFICFVPFGLFFAMCNAISHLLLDGCLWNIYKLGWGIVFKGRIKEDPVLTMDGELHRHKYWKDYWFYTTIGFDQMLHLIFLVYFAERFIL